MSKVGGEQFGFVRAWIEWNASQRQKKRWYYQNWYCENLIEKEDFKKNSENEFKNKWHEKRMYGQIVREMPEEMVDAKWSQSVNWSNDMYGTRTSIKDKLYKE